MNYAFAKLVVAWYYSVPVLLHVALAPFEVFEMFMLRCFDWFVQTGGNTAHTTRVLQMIT